MRIAIDQNISAARDIFLPHGDVVLIDGRQLRQKHLQGVDALVIRSVTPVNAALLDGTEVGFVGTTTIGIDHLDIPWLEQKGIRWASAPGCNADSAAQYTLAMMSLACDRLGRKLEQQGVGIIGRGNVGSRVESLLNALGARTVANDPPRADQGETGLVSLERALAQDIVSLHVPLTHSGRYPTHHLLDQNRLESIKPGALLLNSARGEVVDGEALKKCLFKENLHAALDVWPGEPNVDGALLDATTVATPHVAGYSDDGKRNGAMMIYSAFCEWAGQTPRLASPVPGGHKEFEVRDDRNAVAETLEAACFVATHDRAMRRIPYLPTPQRVLEFDRLRREYPQRRDFKAWRVYCRQDEAKAVLRRLGFTVLDQQAQG